MNASTRITVVLIFLIFAIQAMAINDQILAKGETGWSVDTFTLKAPHNGIGANVPSDAFSPDEDIQICAKLTYNEFPISHYLISFEISGPPDPNQNVTHLYTGQTNDSGLTQTPKFRETMFGEWTVVATVQVASETTINDTLSFRFGWIVQTTSIVTENQSFRNQTTFSKGSNIVIAVNLLNIAMDNKDTILSLEIFDSLGLNINSARTDVSVPANDTPTQHRFNLQIPLNTTNGVANIYINAYKVASDSGGVPYCPQISSSFLIMHRNIAVLQVKPTSYLVYKNESVSIDVKVRNDGDIAESFNITIYKNDTAIVMMPVADLPMQSDSTLRTVWNTGQTEEGRYVIMANASSVPDGDDPSDNSVTDGIVEVMQRIHDLEVTSVIPLSSAVHAGDILDVNVTVRNKGTQEESTIVHLYYNGNIAGSWNISGIIAGDERSMILRWDTTGVAEGNYTISAFAVPVEGEESIDDNTKVDGRVQIMISSVSGYFALSWFDFYLLLLLLTVTLLLLALLYREWRKRERQKDAANSFDSGWTAWYYGHALPAEHIGGAHKRPKEGKA